MSISDRMKKVDLNKMSENELVELEVKLGNKTSEILNQASKDINKVLNIYGLQAKVSYVIEEIQGEQVNG